MRMRSNKAVDTVKPKGFIEGTEFSYKAAKEVLDEVAQRDLKESEVYQICYLIRDICGFPTAIDGFLVFCRYDPVKARSYIYEFYENFSF